MNVILEEDIPMDMSDYSLASKEIASPGWENHCPSSHITILF